MARTADHDSKSAKRAPPGSSTSNNGWITSSTSSLPRIGAAATTIVNGTGLGGGGSCTARAAREMRAPRPSARGYSRTVRSSSSTMRTGQPSAGPIVMS